MADILNQLQRHLPDREGLQVVVTVAMIDGRPEPVGLEIWATHPATLEHGDKQFDKTAEAWTARWGAPNPQARPAAIRTKQLRRLPLSRWVRESFKQARRTASIVSSGVLRPPPPEAWREEANRILTATEPAPAKRPGRPSLYDRSHFEEVAEVYTDALAKDGNPTQAVAEHFVTSKSQAAKWLARCRRDPLNLLPPTVRGVPRAYNPERNEGGPDGT